MKKQTERDKFLSNVEVKPMSFNGYSVRKHQDT
jgi:hypothetical protein